MNYAAMAQALRSERRELLGASAKLGDIVPKHLRR